MLPAHTEKNLTQLQRLVNAGIRTHAKEPNFILLWPTFQNIIASQCSTALQQLHIRIWFCYSRHSRLVLNTDVYRTSNTTAFNTVLDTYVLS